VGAVRLTLTVDDQAMKDAVTYMERRGIKAASRRAVLKTARLGRNAMKADTRLKIRNHPGGYDPYKAVNFKLPKVKTERGIISASIGFTSEGYIDRFLSSGTGERFTGSGAMHKSRRGNYMIRTRDQGGHRTGALQPPLGIVEAAARLVDPQFEAIADLEIQIEVVKAGLS
jgi:hypothetical protein